jgi:hypothetical protein
MNTKICFKCGIEKELSEFYEHLKMSDGHLNKCKKCVRSYSKIQHETNSTNPEWIKSERIRQREKYYRLEYKKKQIERDRNKPWKQKSKYKNLNRNLRSLGILEKGETVHHWNYEENNLQDVFLMSLNTHKKIHKYLTLNGKIFNFNGIPLSNKNRHFLALMDIFKIEGINEIIRQF